MTEQQAPAATSAQRIAAARETVRRETFRLARDHGAQVITRPMYSSNTEPTVSDVEPLAGARAAMDIEAAASSAARDYIRQAREAGSSWDQIGRTLGLGEQNPDADHGDVTAADAAYTRAAGRPDTEAPWRPRQFWWTCRSCGGQILDQGVLCGPSEDEHTGNCPRLAADAAEWHAEAARWDAGWEAGR
jgi:hypothetical protein